MWYINALAIDKQNIENYPKIVLNPIRTVNEVGMEFKILFCCGWVWIHYIFVLIFYSLKCKKNQENIIKYGRKGLITVDRVVGKKIIFWAYFIIPYNFDRAVKITNMYLSASYLSYIDPNRATILQIVYCNDVNVDKI